MRKRQLDQALRVYSAMCEGASDYDQDRIHDGAVRAGIIWDCKNEDDFTCWTNTANDKTCERCGKPRPRRKGGWRKAIVALLLALTPAVAHGQGLYQLGFTLDGAPGPGWVQTPLGVVTEWQYLEWRLTLRGVVPVAEILREKVPHA